MPAAAGTNRRGPGRERGSASREAEDGGLLRACVSVSSGHDRADVRRRSASDMHGGTSVPRKWPTGGPPKASWGDVTLVAVLGGAGLPAVCLCHLLPRQGHNPECGVGMSGGSGLNQCGMRGGDILQPPQPPQLLSKIEQRGTAGWLLQGPSGEGREPHRILRSLGLRAWCLSSDRLPPTRLMATRGEP